MMPWGKVKRPVGSDDGGMVLTLVTGDRLHFRRYEVLRALTHRHAMGYQLAGVAAMVILPVRPEFDLLSVSERLVLCGVTGLWFLGFLLLTVFVAEWVLSRRARTVHFFGSFFVAGGVVTGVLVGNLILEWYLGVTVGLAKTVVICVHFHIYVEAIHLLLMYKAMPRIVRDLRRSDVVPQPVTPALGLEIGGQMFAVAGLRRIEAEGNYLTVVTEAGRRMVPGPFGKVVEALPDTLGMRVGRSDWVASAAVAGLRPDGRDLLVLVTGGDEVRVAQSRRKAVEGWARGLLSGKAEVEPDGEVVRGGGEDGRKRVARIGPEHA